MANKLRPILARAHGGPIDGWEGHVVPDVEMRHTDIANKTCAVYSRRSAPTISPVTYAFERFESFTTSI